MRNNHRSTNSSNILHCISHIGIEDDNKNSHMFCHDETTKASRMRQPLLLPSAGDTKFEKKSFSVDNYNNDRCNFETTCDDISTSLIKKTKFYAALSGFFIGIVLQIIIASLYKYSTSAHHQQQQQQQSSPPPFTSNSSTSLTMDSLAFQKETQQDWVSYLTYIFITFLANHLEILVYFVIWVLFFLSLTKNGSGCLKRLFGLPLSYPDYNVFLLTVYCISGVGFGSFCLWTVMNAMIGFPISMTPLFSYLIACQFFCLFAIALYRRFIISEINVYDSNHCVKNVMNRRQYDEGMANDHLLLL